MFRWRVPAGRIPAPVLALAALIAAAPALAAPSARAGGPRPAPRAGEAGQPAAAPLAWQDLAGRTHTAADRATAATVLVFTSTWCPCADEYAGRVRELARAYSGRGVRFFLVLSDPRETPERTREYAAGRGLELPLVLDRDALLAQRLRVEVTPSAVVLAPGGAVRYSGRVDDSSEPRLVQRHYLRDVLNAMLTGTAKPAESTRSLGCAVTAAAAPTTGPRPVRLLEGLGTVKMTATTRVPAAQRFFQQGMALWYGFNFDEAERSFREAARRDPRCAMAYWGTALSLGMNYNWDFDPAREREVYELVRRAAELSAGAGERERLLIRALARRHDGNPEGDRAALLQAYATAMRELARSRPRDVEVLVLAAVAGMDLRPWDLWTSDGRPQPGTGEIVETLERALKLDPRHIGAHHMYIHAVEASSNPARALPSARLLARLAPRSGHLVHMPAHIFQRVGEYRRAGEHNRSAADLDADYLAREQITGRFVGYYLHNLDFLVFSHAMAGRYQDAFSAARELADAIARYRPVAKAVVCPSASVVASDVLARFGRWEQVLAAPEPPESDGPARLFDDYARGMALLARGDLTGARARLQRLAAAETTLTSTYATGAAGTPYAKTGPLLVKTAHARLAARILEATGDVEGAVAALRAALPAEDALPYAEPALWRAPLREALGGILLRAGRAREAEAVFQEDLQRNRGNGRSLYGLWQSRLKAGAPDTEAAERAFRAAWRHADTRLTPEDL